MSGRIAPSIVRDGLVLYLDAANPASYPGSGTTWYDLTNNKYNLTLSGNITYGGNYLQFNSATDDYAYLNTTALQNYTNITAIVWKYSPQHTTAYESYFGYDYDGAIGNKGWAIRNTTLLNTTQQYQVWGNNGTNSGNDVKLYVNSDLAASTTMAAAYTTQDLIGSWQMVTLTATGVTSWFNNYNLMIGRRSDWVGAGFKSDMDARMSTAMLYNRVLSASEITQNYNALKSRFGL